MPKTQEFMHTPSPKLFDSVLSSPNKSIKTTPVNNFDGCPFKSLAQSTVRMPKNEIQIKKEKEELTLEQNANSDPVALEKGYDLYFSPASFFNWIANLVSRQENNLHINTVSFINRLALDLTWLIDQLVPRDSKYRNLALL